MEILLGGGVMGCMFALYWWSSDPELILCAFKPNEDRGLSLAMISYTIISVLFVFIGLIDITN
jgi:hypothetical protein